MKVRISTLFSRGKSEGESAGNVGNVLVKYARENGYRAYTVDKIETRKRDEYFSSSARVLFLEKSCPELLECRLKQEEKSIDELYETLKGKGLVDLI